MPAVRTTETARATGGRQGRAGTRRMLVAGLPALLCSVRSGSVSSVAPCYLAATSAITVNALLATSCKHAQSTSSCSKPLAHEISIQALEFLVVC